MAKIRTSSISISIENDMLNKINDIKGDVPRSRFILRMLEMMFDNHLDEIKKYVKENKLSE